MCSSDLTEFYYEKEDMETEDEVLQAAVQGITYSEVLEECAKLMQELSCKMVERADALRTWTSCSK